MPRHEVFDRRAVLYRAIDRRRQRQTRFFAAAAFTNVVLGQLFRFAPAGTLEDTYRFLREAGAVLEITNLQWEGALTPSGPFGVDLDQHFIQAEQRVLQSFIDNVVGRNGHCGTAPHLELNRLLNGQHWALAAAPWMAHSRRFVAILSGVRRTLGDSFDFTLESHRVRLGMGIVQDLRQRTGRRDASAYPTVAGWSGALNVPAGCRRTCSIFR